MAWFFRHFCAFMSVAPWFALGIASSAAALEPIAVTEDVPLHFGLIGKPSSGTQTFTLSAVTGAISQGSGDGKAFSGSQRGRFVVTGEPNTAFDLSVSLGPFAGSGVTVSAATVNGATSSVSGAFDSAGRFIAYVGGALTVSTSASVQSSTAQVILTINYQ